MTDTAERPGLGDLNIALLETTFEAVKPRGAELVDHFYTSLFEQHPEVIPMFANANMQEQRGKLLSALALVVANLRHPDALVPAVQGLGTKHHGWGVQPEHYAIVGATLLGSLAHIAGDAWTPAIEEAWSDAYTVIADAMVAAPN